VADIQRLGEYRIDREIARSAIALIYEGYQESLDRKVLIKRLHPHLVGDAELRSRFEREALAIARLKHKNIVHIYDRRADDELVLLVSEWISGGSVEELFRKRGPLSEREAVALAVDVLEGLAVAHEAGIIHRDIKPGNLLISSSGTIKITDFGLAQFEDAPSVTVQGNIMGTPAYMAPELLAGSPSSPRSDLYNLGVTLYELLTGSNPYRSDSVSQTLNRVMSLKPEPLEGVRDDFNAFLMALMEKKPEKRPASAQAALDILRLMAVDLGVDRGWASLGKAKPGEAHTPIRPLVRSTPSIPLVILAWLLMFGVTLTALMLPSPLPEVDTAQLKPQPLLVDTLDVSDLPQTEDSLRVAAPGEPKSDDAARPVVETITTSPTAPVQEEPLTHLKLSPGEEGTSAPIEAEEPEITQAVGEGFLFLTVHPWANVYLNDTFLVLTPHNRPIQLPAGEVSLTLINPEFPPIIKPLRVLQEDTVRVRFNLFDEVGRLEFINANPWAEVYLDGEYLGRTPIGRAIHVRPGRHNLIFRHPSFPDRIIPFDAFPGGESLRFQVDFTASP